MSECLVLGPLSVQEDPGSIRGMGGQGDCIRFVYTGSEVCFVVGILHLGWGKLTLRSPLGQ